MSNRFIRPYILYDEFGEKAILCMSCGKTIKSRTEVLSKMEPNRVIRELAKHADYREIPVLLSDKNILFLMVCDDCKFVDIGEKEAPLVTNQIKEAIRSQLTWSGKTEDVIEETLKRMDRHVVRKAEPGEAATALKGVF